MTQVTIHEAKTHLSKLIQLALTGEEIIIAKGKQPLVKLIALPTARPQRRLGMYPNAIIHIADDFDEPLAEFAEYMS
ncbi:MAG: type II toxin-antitoxin system prevent-host-death family antitoxin [Caldilinea sp. CFX5]|nr:type II toxin-antitoxin system prevent-host-death family antitoxin [Caldilinea sp. CFX5]